MSDAMTPTITQADREAAASLVALAELRPMLLSGSHDDHPYIQIVAAHREAGELAGVRIGKEAALAEVDQQRKDFASPEYATPQPVGSLIERFACNECFNAIDILDPAEVLARHGAKPALTQPAPRRTI